MLKSPYDLAIVIGRFQPFHCGHATLLDKALQIAPQVVMVLGSAAQTRSIKNPFTWQERQAMICNTLDKHLCKRIHFVPLSDYNDDISWCNALIKAVNNKCPHAEHIALVGHPKDALTTQYLHLFPDWQLVTIPQQGQINATAIRDSYYRADSHWEHQIKDQVPPAILGYLKSCMHQSYYTTLRATYLSSH